MKNRAILPGWVLLGAACGALLGPGCRPPVKPGRPAWVVARQHREYTADRFLIGVATGASRAEAVAAARADLTGALRERLSMEFEVRGPKLQLAGSAVLRPQRVDDLAAEPSGLKTALTWTSASGKRHAAMAVVAREELASAAREQISAWEDQALELLTRAKARRAKTPYAAVMDLIATLLLRVQAEEQRAMLAAVSQTEPPAAKGPGLGELVAELDRIRSGFRLVAARGNGLAVRADATDVILVLSADLKEGGRSVPMGSMPVRFELPPDSGERIISARVDAAGMADVKLSSVSAFAGRKLIVDAHPDGTQMLADAGIEVGDVRFAGLSKRLSQPRTDFELTVTDPAAGKVALIIAETRGGEFQQNSNLSAGLARALTAAGYNVVEFDELDVDLPKEPTPQSMAAVLKDRADFLVYGVANAAIDKQIAAGLVFVKTDCQLMVVRVPSGQVLAELKPSARSPGRDLDSAADRACQAVIREASKSIAAALTAKEPADR